VRSVRLSAAVRVTAGFGQPLSMEGHPSAQGEDQVTIQPVSRPISPLRGRMLEDMAMRGLRVETQRDYIRFMQSFAVFLRRPPDTATAPVRAASTTSCGRALMRGRSHCRLTPCRILRSTRICRIVTRSHASKSGVDISSAPVNEQQCQFRRVAFRCENGSRRGALSHYGPVRAHCRHCKVDCDLAKAAIRSAGSAQPL
jgi:hypothetical protein